MFLDIFEGRPSGSPKTSFQARRCRAHLRVGRRLRGQRLPLHQGVQPGAAGPRFMSCAQASIRPLAGRRGNPPVERGRRRGHLPLHAHRAPTLRRYSSWAPPRAKTTSARSTPSCPSRRWSGPLDHLKVLRHLAGACPPSTFILGHSLGEVDLGVVYSGLFFQAVVESARHPQHSSASCRAPTSRRSSPWAALRAVAGSARRFHVRPGRLHRGYSRGCGALHIGHLLRGLRLPPHRDVHPEVPRPRSRARRAVLIYASGVVSEGIE